MKLVDFDYPVHASWFAEQGHRLDPGPYISETFKARAFLAQFPRTEPLGEVASSIFHAGRVSRSWTNHPEYGTPFLSSADIFEADLSSLPLISTDSVKGNQLLTLKPGWTLITRSGMTAGRVTYARLEMDGHACSEDVLRVVPNSKKIPAGYLYTFLASPLGLAMIKGGIYGTSVKHIEPSHIVDLPVPRVGAEIEQQIDSLIQEAMKLRSQFQAGIVDATRDLFESAGLPELIDMRWQNQQRELGFGARNVTSASLRASNYSPRALRIMELLRSVPHRSLGEICQGGQLDSGVRFKRVDSDPGHGVQLIGQREGFWLRPQGRWISRDQTPAGVFAADETVMIASQGLPGESSLICRSMFVTGNWLKFAYTQHFLRVRSGDPKFSGAYLFAFFRSEAAFRMLRSMLAGTGPHDINPFLRQRIPVPECTPADRERISNTVRMAYRLRDEADVKEDQALALLTEAVREAAG